MTVRILEGDCRDVLRALPAESVDSIVTDPPYGLEFMGKDWDAPWKADGVAGGKVSGFGEADGTPFRNKRGTPAFGASGNPTCANCGGDKYRNGPRKCACDSPRFPNQAAIQMRAFQAWCETWASECLRVLKPGGHLLAFGGSRTYHRLACAVEDAGFEIRDQIMWLYGSGFPKSKNLDGNWEGWGTALKPAHEPIVVARKPLSGTVAANVLAHGCGAMNIDGCRVGSEGSRTNSSQPNAMRVGVSSGMTTGTETIVRDCGRWPANIIHDGSDEVLAAFPDAPGQQGDLRGHSRDRKSRGIFGDMPAARDAIARDDSGSAARFFYCAKASREDRNVGGAENTHPTVKPTELMRYLVRLVTPPGGTVLDPFAGSGSTGRAADIEGFDAILIELLAEHAAIARRRIHGDAPLFGEVA